MLILFLECNLLATKKEKRKKISMEDTEMFVLRSCCLFVCRRLSLLHLQSAEISLAIFLCCINKFAPITSNKQILEFCIESSHDALLEKVRVILETKLLVQRGMDSMFDLILELVTSKFWIRASSHLARCHDHLSYI